MSYYSTFPSVSRVNARSHPLNSLIPTICLMCLSDMQRVFHLRPKIGEAARMATFGNYAILFRVIGEVVRIERVVYGGRDLPDVFEL